MNSDQQGPADGTKSVSLNPLGGCDAAASSGGDLNERAADFERSRVKVSVSIFGRATPVELEFEQVERVK